MADMTSTARFDERMLRARTTNQRRDRVEREAGFAAVSDVTTDLRIRTAICAIDCGLRCEDWDVVAEALAMLEDATGYRLSEYRRRRAQRKGNGQ